LLQGSFGEIFGGKMEGKDLGKYWGGSIGRNIGGRV
jgi:hypothetical protein